MPPVTIGRIGFRVAVPRDSQELIVYLDAGGQAADYRIWGGLAVFGQDELSWIERVLGELRASTETRVESDGEVKGRGVSLETAQSIGKRILDEDHRIAFWGQRHAPPTDETISSAKSELGAFLGSLRSDPNRLDQRHVDAWFAGTAKYYLDLKPVNQHKIVAIISHMQWLFSELRTTGSASRLAVSTIVVDRENFPQPVEICGKLIKAFICSGLQAAGMSYRLTGRAMRENMDEGAVTVDIHGDSTSHAGLQLVDILLQVVQRKLQPGGGVGDGPTVDTQA